MKSFALQPLSALLFEKREQIVYYTVNKKIALPVEITDLQLRKPPTGHCKVLTMLELISRGKSTAKIACLKKCF